ncbi:MAG: galactokinase [Lachnospiraceae bacterium]|nr:galactokinase [Lachnospiraceae bacterium]
MQPEELKRLFCEKFGGGGEIRCFFAPGRVNLIGEHTDYNGGHVFPCALTMGNYGVGRRREDRKLRLYSVNFPQQGVVECGLDELVYEKKDGWTNYVKGVFRALEQRGCALPGGMDLLVYGNLPGGAGLSSSAALEVLAGLMARELLELPGLSMTDLALVGQQAENEFCGMHCGIMDQFASAMGQRGCAIFLDTNTLTYRHVDVHLQGVRLVLVNSRVKHSLVNSAYNERRRQCEEALADLRRVRALGALGELTEEAFGEIQDAIRDETCRRRARHAVYENQRTLRAVGALEAGDLPAFGRLLNESHVSLRDDYETSCPETDLLAELAWETPGVLGSRITGGGFGGCTVSLVEENSLALFQERVLAGYQRQTGRTAEIYVAEAGDGAREISSSFVLYSG